MTPRIPMLALALLLVATSTLAAQGEGPVLREAPDLCEALPAAFAADLLGQEVGRGQRPDVTGYPCVYEAEDGRRLAVVAHLGRSAALDGTQIGMLLEYCAAEAVGGVEDLGLEATLFQDTNPDCGGTHQLWVATNVRYEGEQLGVPGSGQVHLLLSLEPEEDADRRLAILEAAARRVIAALGAP